MKVPIMILSKGRAGKAKCIETLLAEREKICVVVEPQDQEAYRAQYPAADILSLADNNKGITYARNTVLQFCEARGFEWFWMLDDDISMMGVVIEGKVLKGKFGEVLSNAHDTFLPYEKSLAIGALEYQQYAWSAKNPYAFNSYCDTCVCLNYSIMKRFRYTENIKEDRDMCLQVLSAGYITARTTRHCFGSPKNGSNAGGLQDAYKAGLETIWSQNMVKRWPGVCEMNIKPDGRPDVKVKWSVFKATRPHQ